MEDITKPNEEPKPITQRLKELEDRIKVEEKKPKVKSLRLPWKARVGRAQAKKNYIGVIRLNENRTITPLKLKIEEGVVEDRLGVPHLGMSEYVWYWKNKPVIIVPSWSFEPIGSKQLANDAERLKTLNVGVVLIKNHMKRNQVENAKKKMGMGPIIILGILAAIGYFMYKSGAIG